MLKGIKVLDLSRVLAGPLCTMMLGDLGADVLKVERPDGGDETRGWGPPFDDRGESAYFLSVNRNKLGIAADLANTAHLAHVRSLAEQADVVVENFRPGVLSRMGLRVEHLRRVNRGLIWCTISGFGPGSMRPGYDFVVQAESGWMSITGARDGGPVKHGVALADVLAGKDAVIAVLSALVERAITKDGRTVHVSLTGSAEAALINVAQNALVSGQPPARWGNSHANLVPYQLFEAADRPIVIAVGNDAQWSACVAALGLADLGADPALRTNAGRLAERARVVAVLEPHLRRQSASHWIALLDSVAVPCGVVRTIPEVLASVEASALTGMPPSVPGSVRRPPPRLGEHSVEVRTLGWAAFH